MKDLNLSFNSPGREPALAGMLQVHPTLRSIGVVEKEPTTRSERTWWLDTRGKEAIGRALLDSPAGAAGRTESRYSSVKPALRRPQRYANVAPRSYAWLRRLPDASRGEEFPRRQPARRPQEPQR